MEINNQTVLNAAKQRTHELEDEILTYKIICTQQAIEIETYKKEIQKLKEELKNI